MGAQRSRAVWDDDEWWINYIGHPYFGATLLYSGPGTRLRRIRLLRLRRLCFLPVMNTESRPFSNTPPTRT